MSFIDAEASDAALAGTSTLLRDGVTEPTYARGPDQIYKNMDSDPLLVDFATAGQPASRLEALRSVAPHAPDLAAIRAEAVYFCRAHQQQGPEFPDSHLAIFGRVQGFESLVNAIATSDKSLTPKKARALLRNAIHDAPAHLRLARQTADLRDKALSRYQMWCYRAADPSNPFGEIGNTRADALNVLGLGYHDPGAELVRWGHMLPAGQRAHEPTAWDAGAEASSIHWRPGGRTFKLNEDDYGPREFVHPPVRGEQISVPIEPLL